MPVGVASSFIDIRSDALVVVGLYRKRNVEAEPARAVRFELFCEGNFDSFAGGVGAWYCPFAIDGKPWVHRSWVAVFSAVDMDEHAEPQSLRNGSAAVWLSLRHHWNRPVPNTCAAGCFEV